MKSVFFKGLSLFLMLTFLFPTALLLAACTAQTDTSSEPPVSDRPDTTRPEDTASPEPLSEVAKQNLERANTLAQNTFRNFYMQKSFIAVEELPRNGQNASIWDYMTLLSMTNRILALDPDNELIRNQQASVIDGLPFYGAKRSDKYAETVYASRRTAAKWSSEAELSYDDQIWLIREFLNLYERTKDASYLETAEKLTAFLIDKAWEENQGGFYWTEGGTTRNTCSNAPMIEVFVSLWRITKKDDYLAWAEKVYAWVRQYLLDNYDHLYYDFVGTTYNKDGVAIDTHAPNKDKHAYNTGSMILAGVALYEATENKNYLRQATMSAMNAYRHFTETITVDDEKIIQYKITTNTWFNLILMEGFLALYPYENKVGTYLDAMQNAIDYAFENHMKSGFLPKLYVTGWEDSKKRLIDMTANAEIYALLAEYQKIKSHS